jgi:uncharacterized damage-inducible protein DinB
MSLPTMKNQIMTSTNLPEVWLRGPLEGVEPQVMPAAHVFLQVLEDLEPIAATLSPSQLWIEVGGAASVGFHLKHIAGSTDRLLTYARGENLTQVQKAALATEKETGSPPATAQELIRQVRQAVESALNQIRKTQVSTLLSPREVGRAKLPTTVLGLLFHAAEHAQRHAGQITTTAKILHGLQLPR